MHIRAFARISVNSSNVQSLLDAANQYQIEPVKKMCVEFLKGQIDATNCLGKKRSKNTVYSYFFMLNLIKDAFNPHVTKPFNNLSSQQLLLSNGR